MQTLQLVAVVALMLAVAYPAVSATDDKGTITGRVVTTHGKAIADARVIATAGAEVQVTTNLKGEFSIELAPGDYRLRFEADGYASSSLRAPVTVVAGRTTKLDDRIELPEANDQTVIRGTVFDTVGRTLTGIKVQLERVPASDGQPVKDLKRDAVSDANGFFVFHLPGGEGRYRMTATSPKHVSASVVVDVSGGEILNAPPLTLAPK